MRAPTLPAFPARLRLRSAALRPLVAERPALVGNHGVGPAGLRPLSTGPRTQAHPPDRKSSSVCVALFVPFSLGMRDSGWPVPFPTHLHLAAPPPVWPATPRCCRGPPLKAAATCDRSAHDCSGRQVLGQLSHVSRPRSRGLDVTRRPALLRGFDSPNRRSPTGGCADG